MRFPLTMAGDGNIYAFLERVTAWGPYVFSLQPGKNFLER